MNRQYNLTIDKRLKRHWLKIAVACALLAALAIWFGSSTTRPFLGKPLEANANQLQRATSLPVNHRAEELLVFLGLSGGGTRAAALAYGVLQELAAHTISTSEGARRVLDEVDVISSVSGGSFTNAYFGLFGDRIFADFKQDMLLRPIESDLLKGLFKPAHWRDLASPYYGRSDMAAAYYDRHVFDGKTFADIDGASSPWIIINATDIGTGDRLVFTRGVFDLLCIDYDSYPIARAVAASSGVPGAATPIAMPNHAGRCGYTLPAALRRFEDPDRHPLLAAKYQSYFSYLEPHRRPWLHLVDGGVTDNLGLREFYTFYSLGDEFAHSVSELVGDHVSDVLIISVNAAVEHPLDWASRPDTPGEREALAAMTHIQMHNFTTDTLYIVREAYRSWQQRRAERAEQGNFDFVEVAFARLEDDAERAYLNELPTSLQLDEEQVDRIIAAGRRLLRDAPHFQRFLARHRVGSGGDDAVARGER